MASEKDAYRARSQHAATLRKLGAHSISVQEVTRGGRRTFAVIVTCERKPQQVPETLVVRGARVPLVVRVGPPFRPEAE